VRIGAAGAGTARAVQALARHGRVELAVLPADPDRSALDDLLSVVDERRLVVLADLAGLNQVVQRLLRRSALAGTPVGAIIDDPQWTGALGLPAEPTAAAEAAATGTPASLGLIRDDRGGIVLGRAELHPLIGRVFGLRGYVEDGELADSVVRTLSVTPDRTALRATVRRGRLHPTRTLSGRAVTVRCEPARLTVDGRDLPEPRSRVTWWYEPACWQLVRPISVPAVNGVS